MTEQPQCYVSVKVPKAISDRFYEKEESKYYRSFTEFVLESIRNLLKEFSK